jgi:hypothetical protein
MLQQLPTDRRSTGILPTPAPALDVTTQIVDQCVSLTPLARGVEVELSLTAVLAFL